MFSLQGKTALITGGSRGIGSACAIELAKAGAHVCLVLRPTTMSSPTIDTLKEMDLPYTSVPCDLDDLPAVRTLFSRALDIVPSHEIHILVNCAGIQRRSPAVSFSEEDWDAVMTVNLKSVWLLCQAAGQHMVPLRRGKIINFASLLTFQGGLTVPANEWSSSNVQVNAIAPGYIETDMNEALLSSPTRLPQISQRIPAGRWGKSEDLTGPCVFLASDASNYVCGEILTVDGGWMAR
ncbi:hypothetical protein F5146DRAFT_1040940 [Armillaria mellea]|nr:hypothetical protein F5146DRAFT_1040940 [Armillaria mellea]